jgi:hypothetical protein
VENSKRGLNFLYTAAFLEFCKIKLFELGQSTVQAIEKVQKNLGVGDEKAEAFYAEHVDKAVRELAIGFYAGRGRILERVRGLKGASS